MKIIFLVELLHHVQLFCDSLDCSLPGSSIHGTFQERILEWDAISYSRGSSWAWDWTCISCFAGRFFTSELPRNPVEKRVGKEEGRTGNRRDHQKTDTSLPQGLADALLPSPKIPLGRNGRTPNDDLSPVMIFHSPTVYTENTRSWNVHFSQLMQPVQI